MNENEYYNIQAKIMTCMVTP